MVIFAPMRVAVIDLGTNTCNLLIAEVSESGFRILYQGKELVKLGDHSILENRIGDAAFARAEKAFKNHLARINDFQVENVKTIATSAVREAKNKEEFTEAIFRKTGLPVEVISGGREAGLIYQGVLLAFGKLKQPALIVDIGGGSNELIFAGPEGIISKESQPTGMARAANRFALSDPISAPHVTQLESFFLSFHQPFLDKIKNEKPVQLIGCSGAFDTIADLIDKVNPGEKPRIFQQINLPDFYSVYKTLLNSPKLLISEMKGMDPMRTGLIVPAVIFIGQIISETGIQQIFQTDYALREGVLYEFMNQ